MLLGGKLDFGLQSNIFDKLLKNLTFLTKRYKLFLQLEKIVINNIKNIKLMYFQYKNYMINCL